MSERITAVVENGVLRPTVPLGLADGTRVELTLAVADGPRPVPAQTRSPAEILAEIAALPNECPAPDPNTARDHDHYLYGAPRRS
jgi:predicted DNA-binding antitoxin AbrB/MazE fold protein